MNQRTEILKMEPIQDKDLQHEQVDKITCRAADLFLSKGIRNVTVDDVAREMGMSKKTIYTIFENKADLINQVVKADMKRKEKEVELIGNAGYDAVEEMLHIGKQVSETLKTFSINIVHELTRFYPETWQLIEEHKNTFVFNFIYNNILSGRKQGLYREDFDADIKVKLYITYTDSILNPGPIFKANYNLSEIYYQHVLHYLHSICNENGRKILEKHLQTIRF